MSAPPPNAEMFRAIVTVGIIEALLMLAGLALYLITGVYWGLVAAAVIGFGLFALIILPIGFKQINKTGGDGQR